MSFKYGPEYNNYYEQMFFIDMSKVSPILLKAIKSGVADTNFHFFIKESKSAEIMEIYQPVSIGKTAELPYIYVKKEKKKDGSCTYSGLYKISKFNGKDIKTSTDFVETRKNFAEDYAKELFEECKQLINCRMIQNSRVHK